MPHNESFCVDLLVDTVRAECTLLSPLLQEIAAALRPSRGGWVSAFKIQHQHFYFTSISFNSPHVSLSLLASLSFLLILFPFGKLLPALLPNFSLFFASHPWPDKSDFRSNETLLYTTLWGRLHLTHLHSISDQSLNEQIFPVNINPAGSCVNMH